MSEAHDPNYWQGDDGLWHTDRRIDIDSYLAASRTRARWERIGIAALVAIGAVLVLAGCTDPPASVTRVAPADGVTLTQAAAPSTKDAAAAYLAAVAPANRALATLLAADAKLPADASGDDFQKLATPVADAYVTMTQALARIQWPTPAIKADATALIGASSVVANDLRGFGGGQNLLGTMTTQLAADSGREQGAVTILRADLGLPPQK